MDIEIFYLIFVPVVIGLLVFAYRAESTFKAAKDRADKGNNENTDN